MDGFPIHLRLQGRKAVVVGAGAVGGRKASALAAAGARVAVIAPDAGPQIRRLAAEGAVAWTPELYDPAHLAKAFLVVAATNDSAVNAEVTRDAEARGLLVCCADDPGAGSFLTPSAVSRGGLTLTVTTGGLSPTLTAVLRERLDAEFGSEWGALTEMVGTLRPEIQSIATDARRKEIVRRIVNDPEILDLARQGRRADAEERAKRWLSSSSD